MENIRKLLWRGYALTQRVPVLEVDRVERVSPLLRNSSEGAFLCAAAVGAAGIFTRTIWLKRARATDFRRGYAAIYCRFAKNGLPTWCVFAGAKSASR